MNDCKYLNTFLSILSGHLWKCQPLSSITFLCNKTYKISHCVFLAQRNCTDKMMIRYSNKWDNIGKSQLFLNWGEGLKVDKKDHASFWLDSICLPSWMYFLRLVDPNLARSEKNFYWTILSLRDPIFIWVNYFHFKASRNKEFKYWT